MTKPSTTLTRQTHMTNSWATDYDSWLVRCSPQALGFSQSNQHDNSQSFEENLGTEDSRLF